MKALCLFVALLVIPNIALAQANNFGSTWNGFDKKVKKIVVTSFVKGFESGCIFCSGADQNKVIECQTASINKVEILTKGLNKIYKDSKNKNISFGASVTLILAGTVDEDTLKGFR